MTQAATGLPLAPHDYLPYLAQEMTEFEDLLRTGDLDAPVVACGDWRLRELGVHLGDVHRWATRIVVTGEVCREEFAPDPGVALHEWYAESAAALLAALRAADPVAPCWHFAAGQRVTAFWFRRQAQETTVHRVDAQRAVGAEDQLDPLVAADGVDEVLTAMLPKVRRWHEPPPLSAPLLLHATDTGHSWLIEPDDLPRARLVDAGSAAATVQTSAANLLLALWKRQALRQAWITGDATVATSFLSAPLTP